MIKLLVVDDEPEIVDSLYQTLHGAYPELEIVKTSISRKARDILRTDVIDILLTDIKMPGVSGLELAKVALGANPDCRVLFLTGYNDFQYAYDALKTGCDDFILKVNTDAEIVKALDKTIHAMEEEAQRRELLLEAEKMRLLITPAGQDENDHVEYIIRYIQQHTGSEISLNQLAAMVYLSPAYLSRIFKSITGSTITEYLTNVRIRKARELLVETNEKIQDIAAAVGIDSPTYFGRIFKKETGLTPQEYRTQHYGERSV